LLVGSRPCSNAGCHRQYSLFRKRRGRPRRHLHLEDIQGVPDQSIVTDDSDNLDHAGFAQNCNGLLETCVGEALRLEQLGADAVDELLVFLLETRRFAAADCLDGSRRDTRLLGRGGMRVPFILCAPEPRSRNDRKLGEAVRQRGASAQMFAQFCGRLADLGSPDQKLERAPEPPASPSDNQIMNAPLGGVISSSVISRYRAIFPPDSAKCASVAISREAGTGSRSRSTLVLGTRQRIAVKRARSILLWSTVTAATCTGLQTSRNTFYVAIIPPERSRARIVHYSFSRRQLTA